MEIVARSLVALAMLAGAGCATFNDEAATDDDGGTTDDASLEAGTRHDAHLPLVDGARAMDGSQPIDSSPPDDDANAPAFDANAPFDANVPLDANPPPSCVGEPDGFNWDPNDPTARCCKGVLAHESDFITDTNCGACGIACNAGNGESCMLFGGHYFCEGCVASASCWSGCCSTSFAPTQLCAASDCAGNCSNAFCPPGTHCVNGLPNSSDYCSY
jgi:hypothetical protein